VLPDTEKQQRCLAGDIYLLPATFHQGNITFRFHCVGVQVQVLSGAPLRNDLWMSGSRAGRARLDSKGLSSFKIVAADAGPRFCF